MPDILLGLKTAEMTEAYDQLLARLPSYIAFSGLLTGADYFLVQTLEFVLEGEFSPLLPLFPE